MSTDEPTAPGEVAAADTEVVRIHDDTVRIRRAPKIPAFIVVGALVGLIVVLIVTALFPVDPKVGYLALAAYFGLYGVVIGAVIGAVIGILVDRSSTRRAKSVGVERTSVEAGPVEGDLED